MKIIRQYLRKLETKIFDLNHYDKLSLSFSSEAPQDLLPPPETVFNDSSINAHNIPERQGLALTSILRADN